MPERDTEFDAPPVSDYKKALLAVRPRMSQNQWLMLKAHYESPSLVLTSEELARAAGYENFEAANSQYGRVGTMIAEETGFLPSPQKSSSFASFYRPEGSYYRWELRPQMVKALAELRWFDSVGIPGPSAAGPRIE